MSDTLRRRIAALLLVAGIAVAVLAIEDVGPFSDPPTQEEVVQGVVEDFFNAAAQGDSKTFCRLLTDDARKTLEVNYAQRLQTDEPLSCAEILDTFAAAFKGSSVDVRVVSVSGIRARVETRYKLADSPAQPRTVLLQLEDGGWRISNPDA
jgi:Putative lumazine-binding